MSKKDVYIWYSGATDITGKKLQEELDITGGRKQPVNAKTVIGWGTKTKKDSNINADIILNHPNTIRKNRNKLETLRILSKANVAVANFVESGDVLAELKSKKPIVVLPLVGRTKFHQGGKGFWMCLTRSHVKNAIDEGAHYFQNYIDVADEYRVHVFQGKVIHAQKKVKRDNLAEAYVKQHKAKVNDYAKKGDIKLDENTMDYVLGRIASEHNKHDMIVRSNKRGWRFSNLKNPSDSLSEISIRALDAMNMQFGAVDCVIDCDGGVWILEINSGPGLEGKTFEAYKAAFTGVIEKVAHKAKVPVKKEIKVGGSKLKAGSAKERLSGIRELLDLVEGANEAEAKAIENLLKKKLSAQQVVNICANY